MESGDPARKPVGTGPFEFVDWVQGDHITVKKNPDYFKTDKPHVDSVVFKFLANDQSRIDALSAGEIDWVDAVPLQQVPTLSKDPRFTYVTSKTAGIPDFLAMNTTKAPFNDVKVRQAFALAVDRSEIRDVAYLGTGEDGWRRCRPVRPGTTTRTSSPASPTSQRPSPCSPRRATPTG